MIIFRSFSGLHKQCTCQIYLNIFFAPIWVSSSVSCQLCFWTDGRGFESQQIFSVFFSISFLLFLFHLCLYFYAPTAKMLRISTNLVLLVLHKLKISLFWLNVFEFIFFYLVNVSKSTPRCRNLDCPACCGFCKDIQRREINWKIK